MLTRSQAKAVNSSSDSEAEDLNATVVDMADQNNATAASGGSGTNAELSALIASISALRQSVQELREETSRGKTEIQQLRARVEANVSVGSEVIVSGAPGLSNEQTPSTSDLLAPTSTALPAQILHHTNADMMLNTAIMPFAGNPSTKLYPLPPFSGNPEDWPLFIANFNDTTAEFRYNNRQNLLRLHTALQGDARRAVTSLLIYPNDVPNVIEELKFNFGRPEILIRSQLEKVRAFPVIYENRLENVLRFANRVRNIVAFFKSAECSHHLTNPTLLDQLLAKLPPSKQYEWSRHAVTVIPFPTVETFSNWISELAKAVSQMPTTIAAATSRYPQQQPQRHAYVNRSNAQSTQPHRVLHSEEAGTCHPHNEPPKSTCLQCNRNHNVADCDEFKSLQVDSKWALVKRNRLCFACLQKGHNLTNCRRKKLCGKNGCTRLHNQYLHQDRTGGANEARLELQATGHVLNCHNEVSSHLFKILPVVLSGPNGDKQVFAMFDDGSSVSLLEEDTANALGLKGPSTSLTLQWYGEQKKTETSKRVSFDIRAGCEKSEMYALKNVRTVKSLDLPTQRFCKDDYEHLRNLALKSYENAKPVLLIGIGNGYLGVPTQVAEAASHQPIAISTKLGWVAFGPGGERNSGPPRVLHFRERQTLKELERVVDEYLSIETFGIRNSNLALESDDDIRARKILTDTTKKVETHYEVGLLWRNDDVQMPPSYDTAKQRLLNVENRMARDPAYGACYKAEIDKYVQKNYAQLLSQEESQCNGPKTWYLPHFGVRNINKPGKLRIVFDAAATTRNISLNSALLKGPEKAQPLLSIMHKFRQGAIAIAADVQEMFSQVKIRPADQDSQRFLWRDGDQSKPIRVYRMSSMIFGANCSPCCAEYVKNINATQFYSSMPRGADAVIGKMYVDDLVASFESLEDAEQISKEAVHICAAAGFNLRGFVSNSQTLQETLNGERAVENIHVLSMERQSTTDKILGLFWNTRDDVFEFNFKFNKIPKEVLSNQRPPTKREMLGLIMSIFDPFGFLAHYTIFTKLLMQATWKRQIEWDDPLPNDIYALWNMWWKQFEKVRVFHTLCYSPTLLSAEDVQLHVFVDASSKAFAAVAYLRIKKGNDIHVAFVSAKSRCAPPKGMTIPRLELQAALLGSRLSTYIEISQTHYWSDSKTVVQWIRSTTRNFKPFVATRISEILTSSTPSQWHWLPTVLNVADDATRANMPSQFNVNSRWTTGPDFLCQSKESWPREPEQMSLENHGIEEEMPSRLLLATCSGESLLHYSNYSSYFKMLRVLAWMQRFIQGTRKITPRFSPHFELTASEIDAAEKVVCRQVQATAFAKEVATLKSGQSLPKSSAIHQLTPYIDDDGILRVKGRLDAASCLPFSARRPIIMPRKHHVSCLIMRYYHVKRHHQNDHLVANEMRQKFWIPHARALLQYVKRECLVCAESIAQPKTPLMGQLPLDRVTPYVRPFSYTGVYYCGPFLVAIGRRREKRWVALFTCLTTRAIHLEIVEDLSTDAFILCFRNFINRRGTPVRMRSDNGTNFVGAQKHLLAENRLFDVNEVQRYMSGEKIEWIFNCPGNPSAGGCWERLIGCVKRLLQRVLKESAPRLGTFRSVLIEAENIINSRPLTELPLSTADEEPLTPNHFLVGCLNSTQTPKLDDDPVCLRKQWRIAQNLKDCLWKRWCLEYLPQLLRRSKWTPLKVGELVIICEPNAPRSKWEKGIITRTFVAKDGQVRTAEVKTAHGLIRRPTSKLAALSISESP